MEEHSNSPRLKLKKKKTREEEQELSVLLVVSVVLYSLLSFVLEPGENIKP